MPLMRRAGSCPDSEQTLNMASLASISVWVGLFGSLTGLGGAGVLIPIMVLAGIPVKEAIACGVVAIIATSRCSPSPEL